MGGLTDSDIGGTSRPVWKRCWCLQWGRCLTECPTADLPRPVPFTDANWRKSYADVVASGSSDS